MARMNLEELSANSCKIEKSISSLKDYSTRHDYRGFWRQTKQLVEMFKTLKLSKQDREKLWEEYDSQCKSAKERIKERKEQTKDYPMNAAVMRTLLRGLRVTYQETGFLDCSAYGLGINLSCTSKKFWAQARRIGELFKYPPLLRQDREKLWEEYDSLCKEMKAKTEVLKKGREDAKTGNIDLRKYATDGVYKFGFDSEEIRQYEDLADVEDPYCRKEFSRFYQRVRETQGDDKADYELEKRDRRAKEDKWLLERIRKKREKEIRKLFKKRLVDRIMQWFSRFQPKESGRGV